MERRSLFSLLAAPFVPKPEPAEYINPNRRLLFRVHKPESDHWYKIYDDGSTEGFGDGSTFIFNSYPTLRNADINELVKMGYLIRAPETK